MFNSERTRRHSMALATCSLLWAYRAALSDCPTPAADKTDKTTEEDYRREAISGHARSLNLSLDDDESDVTLVEEPLLRWRNAIRGGPGGGTYLWTAKGLPVAMCCVWWSGDQRVHLAFHSLTEKPIRATKNGEPLWHSVKPGVTYQDVPNAPAVARSAAMRLTQLRNIAREFDAELVFRDQKREELRLLPQPLYRYGGNDSAITDGAVFAFATGTDPELILQIEAVGRDDDALRWRYAVTRRTGIGLRLSHMDREIWSCSASEGAFDEPFFVCPAR